MRDLLVGFSWSDAIAWSAGISAVGHVVHGLEILAVRREFGQGGLLNWSLLRTRHPRLLRSRLCGWAEWIFSAPVFLTLIVFQLACAILVARDPWAPPASALGSIIAVRVLFHFRNSVALLGADQMHLVVLSGAFVHAVYPTPAVARAAAWFICLQLLLAYSASGLTKLATPVWRSGEAIRGLIRTRTFGHQELFDIERRFPVLAPVAAWTVLGFESAVPGLVFGGTLACAAFLAAGTAFHVSLAVVMGLDEFAWAFLAAYPVTLRCSMEFERLWTA